MQAGVGTSVPTPAWTRIRFTFSWRALRKQTSLRLIYPLDLGAPIGDRYCIDRSVAEALIPVR
jgi:hypothetical protein